MDLILKQMPIDMCQQIRPFSPRLSMPLGKFRRLRTRRHVNTVSIFLGMQEYYAIYRSNIMMAVRR